ncbi:MAG: hypothetical protein K1X66_02810 [Verrucomicrobiae bacterium]|nr:hypothetical protein [Verrucomicrobiae bacterium]
MLWIHARFHLRPEKAFPTWQEIFYHTLLWSFLMEWLFPLFWKKGTADTKDIFAYLIGAMGSGLYWTYRSQFRNQEK